MFHLVSIFYWVRSFFLLLLRDEESGKKNFRTRENFDVRLLHLLFAILWYFDAVAQSLDRFSKQRNSRVVSRTKGTNGALTEQWLGCAPIRSFLRVNRDLHRNRIITRFALEMELGISLSLRFRWDTRFESEKNFLPLQIFIRFFRAINVICIKIRRKNKSIVLECKFRRYVTVRNVMLYFSRFFYYSIY